MWAQLLLHACVRAQALRPNAEHEGALRVALAVPASMAPLGLRIGRPTLDLVLKAHTKASRIYRAVRPPPQSSRAEIAARDLSLPRGGATVA